MVFSEFLSLPSIGKTTGVIRDTESKQTRADGVNELKSPSEWRLSGNDYADKSYVPHILSLAAAVQTDGSGALGCWGSGIRRP